MTHTSPLRPRKQHWLLPWFVLAAAGCGGSDDDVTLACPILAPGTPLLAGASSSLDPASAADEATGAFGAGEMVAHAFAMPADAKAAISAHLKDARAVLAVYGPRDAQGGFSSCRALVLAPPPSGRAEHTLDTTDGGAGEYLILVGGRAGSDAAEYDVTVECTEGCAEASPGCPTLAALGCPDIRCDGELVRDASGCATCECDPGALCGPDRRGGPWGTCVLPACECDDQPPAAVCGADGETWSSACDAFCAGVPVTAREACAVACPAVTSCDEPCDGLRRIDPASGCPGCECAADTLPDAPADCAACPLDYAPVCGADGVTYWNRCEASCAGAHVLYAASCAEGCRRPPAGCALDCPWGLRLGVSEDACLICECAEAPPAACVTAGLAVCAEHAALAGPVSVGSPCLANHLGVTDADWGPCGQACATDADCPAGDRCAGAGSALAGRCLLGDPICGCPAIDEPICGTDGLTHRNACEAHCVGVDVAKSGACCTDEAPECPSGEAPALTSGGCPDPESTCGPPSDAEEACRPGGGTAMACAPDGTELGTSACEAHLVGLVAAPAWCTP